VTSQTPSGQGGTSFVDKKGVQPIRKRRIAWWWLPPSGLYGVALWREYGPLWVVFGVLLAGVFIALGKLRERREKLKAQANVPNDDGEG
jgi:hypothetical protein